MIEALLEQPQYGFVDARGKAFIAAFVKRMAQLGYTYGDAIVDGICYGRYMLIFRKAGVKSKRVYARIYMRDSGVVLRLFLNDVTKHARFIEVAPEHIKSAFTGDYAKCNYCRGEDCKFRKSYNIAGADYDKCNGLTFEFFQPSVERLESYIELFTEFYRRGKEYAD